MKFFLYSLPIALIPMVSFAADDGAIVHRWVKAVVETSLDYHCRAKFGDTERTITSNPDKLTEKWQQLDVILSEAQRLNAPRNWVHRKTNKDLNEELVQYFRKLRRWELWLRSSKEDYHRKMDFFLMRIALETVGGEEAEKLYDMMPEDLEANQDLRSVVNAGMQRELENGSMQHALEIARLGLIDSLTNINDTDATATANELMRLANKAEFEQEWLKQYRPGLITKDFVENRKKLFAIKQSIASRMTTEKLERIQECPGVLCRQFIADYSLAAKYEQQGMPGQALSPAERYRDLLDRAYKESVQWSAAKQGGTGALAATLMELLLATTDVYEPRRSSDGEPFDYVNPIDIKTIQRQAQAIREAGEDYGFVGMIDGAETVKAVHVVGSDTLVALGQTGLATYDLQSGKLQNLLYDLRPDIKLGAMAVADDGKFAYVITDDPVLHRYDLTTGQRDASFSSPEAPRSDAKLAVSPDGKTVAVGVLGKVYFYNATKGKELGFIKTVPNLSVYGLQFGPGGRTIIIYGNGPLNYEFDLRSGAKKHERRIVADKSNTYTYRMQHANGILAAAGLGALAAWPEGSDEPIMQVRFEGYRGNIQVRWGTVTPDQKHFLCSHGIWDLPSGDTMVRFLPHWNAEAMALTADGSRLVIAAQKTLFVVPSCIAPVAENKPEAQEKPKTPQRRTWTDKSGKYKISATLIKVDGDIVTLEKPDGTRVQVPLRVLSAEDTKHLKELE